jgi:hypothetical protein
LRDRVEHEAGDQERAAGPNELPQCKLPERRERDAGQCLDAHVPAIERRETQNDRGRDDGTVRALRRPEIGGVQGAGVKRKHQRRQNPFVVHRYVDDVSGYKHRHGDG